MDAVPTTPSADEAKRQPQAASTGLGRLRLTMAILWTVVIMMLCWLPGPMVQELEHGSSWFSTLNQARLMMDQKHHLHPDEEADAGAFIREVQESDPSRIFVLMRYEFYSWIQEWLVQHVL